MFSFRPFVVVSSLLVLLTAIGCQNANSSPSASTSTLGKAVVATTGNGSTTIYLPNTGGSGVKMLSTSAGTGCPDCANAAEHYFETGELVAVCPSCHATRVAVTSHN